MKTAIQQLVDIMNEDQVSFTEWFQDNYEMLLEKEKEQIKKDYNNGFYKKTLYLTSDDLEDYYNQTYTQNK